MGSSPDLPVVSVFGASTVTVETPAWAQAEACGRLLAEVPVAVATGGYGGAMEAVSAGAASVNGHVIGVSAPQVFPERRTVNPYVVVEIPANTITERIHKLVTLSAASIVLPGSLGTLAELVAAWNTAFVARFSEQAPKPIITIGEEWQRILDHLAEQLSADRTMITSVHTVADAVAHVRSVALG